MKVLMLGWEFPPHISGGLGTACYGITRGLAAHGVDVTFVVPRVFGDEDTRYVDLLGLHASEPEQAPAEDTSAEDSPTEDAPPADPGAPTGASSQAAPQAVPVDDAEPTPAPEAPGAVSVLALDSLLRPYLGVESYAARWTRLRGDAPGAPGAPAADGGDESGAPLDDPVAEARARAAATGTWSAFVDAIVEAPPTSAAHRAFGGGYGAGLMEEVGRYAEAVAEMARTLDYDIVHAHDWMTYAAGAAAARLRGVPLVVHMHATEYDRTGDSPDGRVLDIEHFGLDAADRIVAVSHFTAGVLHDRYAVEPERIRVVHNAVDAREEIDRPERNIPEPIVLFLGRVTFQKGPEYFLEAARKVIGIRPDVKFVMSGSGDMLPSMIEHAARIGVGRHVHFTGFLRGKDVERMYGMADLYVMPSVSEPFGITPLEALALEVPVIVSKQSGVSEVLRNALKVDFWDVDELANKMLAVLERPALRSELRAQGRAEVRGMRWEASGSRLRTVYEEVLS